MREFGKLAPQIWTGNTGKALRKMTQRGDYGAQILAIYLITSPHAHQIGLYYLPFMYMVYETGLSEEQVRGALEALEGLDFCHYDEESEYILVTNMVRHQVGHLKPEDNRVKAVKKDLDIIPESPLKEKWLALHGGFYYLEAKGLLSPSEAPSKGLIIEGEGEGEGDREGEGDLGADAPKLALIEVSKSEPAIPKAKPKAWEKFLDIDLPEPLATVGFRAKWREFVISRAENRHPLTDLACRGILNKLLQFSPEVGIQAMQNSINSGWRDVFPDKVRIGNGQSEMGNLEFARGVFQ